MATAEGGGVKIQATRTILIDVPGAATLNEAVATVYGPDSQVLAGVQGSGWSFAEVKDAAVGAAEAGPVSRVPPESCTCDLSVEELLKRGFV